MIKFFKNNCKNLNPWQNIKILHTNIFNDIIAGIMVAIIVLPLALAFGEMSGLGPEAGIWSAVVGGIFHLEAHGDGRAGRSEKGE